VIGPYGGGNSFLTVMSKGLQDHGHSVVYSLDSDVDVVVIIDPRWRHPLKSFSLASLVKFLILHKTAIVVHRINECDERKGTKSINRLLRLANYLADGTVYVASWLKRLDLRAKTQLKGEKSKFDAVILNGSDSDTFFPDFNNDWDSSEKLRLVTHHWSSHPMKGTDLYLAIDRLLIDSKWRNQIDFTYVGNWDLNQKLNATKLVPPLHGQELAKELRSHHVYVTASRNEPGGNHQNEGALSGLPLIFINSGCLPEYCSGYGVQIENIAEIENAIEKMMKSYSQYRVKMRDFPNTSNRMIGEYVKYFENLVENKDEIRSNRRLWRNPFMVFRLLFPL
jgi:hypothetical protein